MKRVFLMVAMVLILAGCKKQGNGTEVEKPVCESENDQLLFVLEKNDKCGTLSEFLDNTGKVGKDKIEMYAGGTKIELNFLMVGDGQIFITPARALFSAVYTGEMEEFTIQDRINRRSYSFMVQATKRDKCGIYYGYEKDKVFFEGEKVQYLEKDGKSYIRMTECCECAGK